MKTITIKLTNLEHAAALAGTAYYGYEHIDEYIKKVLRDFAERVTND